MIDPLLDLDLPEIGFDAELIDPAPCELDGEFGPVDGDIYFPQEVGESAGVILMAMGQDDTLDIARPLDEPGPVGEDQVDAEHVLLGEHEAAVDEGDLPVDLYCRTISADLP